MTRKADECGRAPVALAYNLHNPMVYIHDPEIAKQIMVKGTSKDDTLPCKRQALAWQKEPNTWTQALQRYKQFFNQLGV